MAATAVSGLGSLLRIVFFLLLHLIQLAHHLPLTVIPDDLWPLLVVVCSTHAGSEVVIVQVGFQLSTVDADAL